MAARNPYETIIQLLRTEWNAENTDAVVPEIIRYTEEKIIDFRKNSDWIIIKRFHPAPQPAGIGSIVYHDTQKGIIDVRCLNPKNTKEQHFLEVIKEIDRILDTNFNQFAVSGSDYDIIERDGDRDDRSDEYKGFNRMTIPVKLIKYSVQRGS